jgi:predicted 3-demethylubiquinone-9 3-methyltransferase (glyoxalase superfamily)
MESGNKYGAIRTWSELCQRTFDSKAEAKRGEELALMERAGEIGNLTYQMCYSLSVKPKVTITIDFVYQNGATETFFEDVKGVLTRDFRTKLAWLKEKYGIEVKLITKEGR